MPVTKEGEAVQNTPVNNKFTRYGDLVMGIDSTGKARFFSVDETGVLSIQSPQYTIRIDETSQAGITYIGKAIIGSLDNNSVWQVQKIIDSTIIEVIWADGNNSFDNIWDNRLILTYL